ncbi:hypothetical protein LCGC14_3061070, partial [marine sediment metagenome]
MTTANNELKNIVDIKKQSPKELTITVNNLKTYYPVLGGLFKRTLGYVKAVDGVSFDISKGETMGLVGESGCGKTTIGNTILNLVDATEGSIYLENHQIWKKKKYTQKSISKSLLDNPYTNRILTKWLKRIFLNTPTSGFYKKIRKSYSSISKIPMTSIIKSTLLMSTAFLSIMSILILMNA